MKNEFEEEILERLEQVKAQRSRLAKRVGILEEALEYSMEVCRTPNVENCEHCMKIQKILTGSQPVEKGDK